MSTFKTLMLFVFTGAIIGYAAISLIAPSLVSWYNTPGAGQALCNCLDNARGTVSTLIRAQLVGGGLGGLVFLVFGILFVRRQRRKAAASAAKGAVASSAARAS